MYLYIKPMYSLVNIMFNNRMQKIAQAPESNITVAQGDVDDYAGQTITREAESIVVVPKPGKEKEAMAQIIRENESHRTIWLYRIRI